MPRPKPALLVLIERETGLGDYIATGIYIDSVVTEEVLINVFCASTPYMTGRRSSATGGWCGSLLFAMTDNPYIKHLVRYQHRAAIGVSEVSDAVAIVCIGGNRGDFGGQRRQAGTFLDEKQLRDMLTELLVASKKVDNVTPFSGRR